MLKKLAIVSTHPIQYNAPLFALLNQRKQIELKVFYTWGKDVLVKKYDPGFDKVIEWDIPLLKGYNYSFVNNVAKHPGSHHFRGVDNPELIDEITTWNADAVLVYGWSFKSHLKAMRYFKGKLPVLFRGDSTLLDEHHGIKNILKTVFLRRVYKFVDKAIFVGLNNKAYFLKYGVKLNDLIWAPHAIDNERFRSSPENLAGAKLLRQQLEIPAESLVFVFAGKFEPKKNPLLLLRAFVALDRNNAFLVMVGNGPMEKELKKDFGSRHNIAFLDFQNQSNMPAVYQLADIFVLPSQGPGETWGLAINEAMAAGKPVLASDKCGGAADLVKNDINGFIFKSGDLNDLREKLIMFLRESRLTEMGLSSQKIIDEWSFTATCSQIEHTVLRLN